ncbi:MAG: hypothetical protein MK052_08590 [Alphaproteobacteria bacterium]|nr:hypothetical protein [Alphaproteobacteria bacterium]
MVLLVLSIVSATGLSIYTKADNQTKTSATLVKIAAIEEALRHYRYAHHRLPCPADGTLTSGDPDLGAEGQYTGICVDSTPAANFSSGNTVAGVIPVNALNLPAEYMYDAWGRRFTYVVDRRLTENGAFLEFKLSDQCVGSINVTDINGNERTDKAIYLIASHGSNGHGAFLSSGVRRNANSENASELLNASVDASFSDNFDSDFVMNRVIEDSSNVLDSFDDIVRYKERWSMINNQDIAMNEPYEAKDGLLLVVTGNTHTCGIDSTGATFCWGRGTKGQLGDNSGATSIVPVAVQLPVGVSYFTNIGPGKETTCALGSDKQGYCWGLGTSGQLGNSGIVSENAPVEVSLPGGVANWKSIGAGTTHACAIADTGDAYCWGSNADGLLGDGTINDSTIPKKVTMPAGVDFTKISVNEGHSCALSDAGQMYCWGINTFGQLGDGSNTSRDTPTLVDFLAGVSSYTSMSAGLSHTCAIGNDNQGYCWGRNFTSALGSTISGNSNIPRLVSLPAGASSYKSISAGINLTCGITGQDKLYCWGLNNNGRLGINEPDETYQTNTPTAVVMPEGVTSVKYVTAGGYFGCMISNSLAAYCWGGNGNGQIGDGTTTNSHVPVKTTGTLFAKCE